MAKKIHYHLSCLKKNLFFISLVTALFLSSANLLVLNSVQEITLTNMFYTYHNVIYT
jgi:hypothetical protein